MKYQLVSRSQLTRKGSDSSGGNPQSAQSHQSLKEKANTESRIIRKVALSFSEGEATERKIQQKLRSVIDNHDFVKLFIDCKNLKIKEGPEYDLYDFKKIAKIVNFNVRGSAILLRVMLKNMQFFKNGAVISVLNCYQAQDYLKQKQSLYYASMLFKASMVDSVNRTSGDDVKFLTVYNRNRNLDNEKDKARLVRKSLQYVGLKNKIEV